MFQSLTGEGWSDLMYMLWKSYSKTYVGIYFMFLIFFGSFFVLNLFLAVISNNFEKETQKLIIAKRDVMKSLGFAANFKAQIKKELKKEEEEEQEEAEIKVSNKNDDQDDDKQDDSVSKIMDLEKSPKRSTKHM